MLYVYSFLLFKSYIEYFFNIKKLGQEKIGQLVIFLVAFE